MPSISYPRLALTNLGFLVRAEISYRVTFSEPEWQMAVAGSNFGAGGFKWRDHFSIYAHDGAQGTRLFDLNGSFLPIYDRDPYRSLNMERSFNLSRFVLNEDLFGADEIRCKIKVFPQISEELLFEEDLTQIVSLPGGFPFLPRWARRKRPPAISSSPPDAEP